MVVSDEEEVQKARLKYVLAQHVEAGLVERVDDWPGVTAARELARGEVLEGTWFNRTKEWYARRRGEKELRKVRLLIADLIQETSR